MDENVMNRKSLWNGNGEKRVQEHHPAGRGQAAQWTLKIAGAIVCAVFLTGVMVAPLCAQPYPNKRIRFILPFATGGSADTLGRIVGQKLAEGLGQPVVPENRPGAGGNVGYEFVSKSKPDGYILLLGSPSLVISPSLYKTVNYDPIKDLAPISVLVQNYRVVIVRSSLPVQNLKEFVEFARANPGKLSYSTGGIGTASQLGIERLKSLTKIDIMVVQYKSEPQALLALLGGEVDMQAIAPELAVPQIQAGKVKALAMLSNERVPSLPDVPTAKEAGIDNCEVTVWYGLLAPAGTPRDVIDRLNAEWVKIAAMPEVRERLQKAGFKTLSSTPEQFAESLKAEKDLWANVTKEANIFGIY